MPLLKCFKSRSYYSHDSIIVVDAYLYLLISVIIIIAMGINSVMTLSSSIPLLAFQLCLRTITSNSHIVSTSVHLCNHFSEFISSIQPNIPPTLSIQLPNNINMTPGMF